MKKLLLICLTLLLLNISQQSKAQTFEVGLIGGIGASAFSGEYATKQTGSPKFVYSAGLNFKYIKNHFTIGTNFLYELKGEVFKVSLSSPTEPDASTGETKWSRNLEYISLPVLVGYRFGRHKALGLNLGPNVSYLLNQKDFVTIDLSDNEVDFTDYWEKWDFGITTSVDYQIPLSSVLKLSLEGRTNIGLLNIRSSDATNQNIKNQSFLFLLGLNYVIKYNKPR